MLLLTRRSSESVVIGNDIRVTVLEIKGQQVVLGFEAPKDVSVHRLEIFEKIQHEKANTDVLEEEG